MKSILMKMIVGLAIALTFLSCKKNDKGELTPVDIRWTKLQTQSGLTQGAVLDIMFDRSGNLWAAFTSGVGKYDGTSWKIFKIFTEDSSGNQSSNVTHALMEDRQGNIWATIEDLKDDTYACKFDGTTWTKQFLCRNPVRAILELPNGNLWFGSNGNSAFIFDGVNWSKSDCNGQCYAMNSICKDPQNNVWIGVGFGKVIKYDGTKYSIVEVPYTSDFPSTVTDVTPNAAGGFFACSGGAWQFSGAAWKKLFPPPNTFASAACTLQDSKGRIWIGTQNAGVYWIDGTQLKEDHIPGLNDITSLAEDKNGVIWAGAGSGIWKYDLYR